MPTAGWLLHRTNSVHVGGADANRWKWLLQVSGIASAMLSPDCADEQLFWMALSDLEMSRRPVKYFSSRLTSGCKAVRHKFLLSLCYFCRAGVTVAPRAMEEMCLSMLVHLTSVSVWRKLCARLCFDNMQTSLIIKEALNCLTCKHWTSLFWLDVIAASEALSQSHLYKIDQSVFVYERLLGTAGHSGVIYGLCGCSDVHLPWLRPSAIGPGYCVFVFISVSYPFFFSLLWFVFRVSFSWTLIISSLFLYFHSNCLQFI